MKPTSEAGAAAEGLLFSSIALRGLELENRIVYSPMGQYMANRDGSATEWHKIHLGTMALSGVGLVFTEAAAVSALGRDAPTSLGLFTDAHEEALAGVVETCRRYAPAKHAIQLWHAGRKGSMDIPWHGWRQLPPEEGGWLLSAPSPVGFPGRTNPLKVLDKDDIGEIVQQFARSATRAARASYDLLEIHCAHGYLLHSFLSPVSNRREDEFGGSRENRMRFPLAVFEAARKAWPADRPMGVRVSATDWIDGGWDIEDTIAFATRLKALGCDYVTASSGGSDPSQKIRMFAGYQVDFAAEIRRRADLPTMAVGLITDPGHADYVVRSGKADMVALGRGLLREPRWPWHAAEMLGGSIHHPDQFMRGGKTTVWQYSSALKR
ncbi:MAG: NADH:flavin oxidoreductase/NADH oxidase [Rhizobiaceae bacterium]|nr:NADH:flavin oxidoreductase/NADH oxidase [Rhizobiaceae bacterium]